MGKYGKASARRLARVHSLSLQLTSPVPAFCRPARPVALAAAAAMLAAAVLAAAVPLAAFAVDTNDLDYDCAYICSELGVLIGEGDGVTPEYLMKESTRVQAAYLTLRLVGKESEAESYSGTDNFNDVGGLYPGGQRRTAYLKAHSAQYGWQGDGTGRLMPDDKLTPQQFYKVLLTVLGYTANVDYDYDDTLDFADRTADMNECSQFSTLINDDIAVMMVEALFATVKGKTYTLAEFLANEGVIDYNRAVELGVITEDSDGVFEEGPAVEQPPASLAVSSVGATNFAEIDIVFNQKIDPSSVDPNYIKVNDAPLAATDVVCVMPDGLTVRVYRPSGFVSSQGDEISVTISRVRSLDGALQMASADGLKLTFRDNQYPSLISVEAQGLRRVKLTFSEPIRVADAAVKNYSTYRFNGRTMQSADAAEVTGREVYLSFMTPLDEGQNTLAIERNRIYDLAGFPIEDVDGFEFEAEADTSLPQVVGIDPYREKVSVTFSKEVKMQARMYWLDGTAKRYATSSERNAADRNVITFIFAESSYLPAGSVDVVVEGIADYNGNTVEDHRATVVPQLDTTRPAVIAVESKASNEVVVEFSKPVKAGTSNNGRFTLRNSSNTSVTLGVQSYTPSGAGAPDARFVKLTGTIPPGEYTLTVVNVEDTTAQANRSDASTHNVTVRDAAPPAVISVSASIAESKVVIAFDRPLDWSSASDIGNYQWNWPGRGHVAMPSGSSATLKDDQRTVVVQFPLGGWVVGGNAIVPNAFVLYVATDAPGEMRVLGILGTNGNTIETQVIDVPSTNEVAAKLQQEAYAVSRTRLVVKFDASGALPVNASASDFILRVVGGTAIPLKAMGVSNIDTARREISFELMEGYEMNANGTYGPAGQSLALSMLMPNSVTLTKTALGTPLEIKDGVAANVVDNIKPGILEALRGSREAHASGYISGLVYPSLKNDQILIVLDERVRLFGITSADQLGQMLEIRTESQPDTTLPPSAFEVIALNESNVNSTLSSEVETRMLQVTLKSAYSDAVSVTVRSNYLWDGNMDSGAQYVMNATLVTDFLPPN